MYNSIIENCISHETSYKNVRLFYLERTVVYFVREIYYLNIPGSKNLLEDFLDNINIKVKKKLIFLFRYVMNKDNALCEPYIKHFSVERYRHLYEMRLKADGSMVRFLFFFKSEDELVILNAFYKRDKKDTEQALDYALKLLKEARSENIYPLRTLERRLRL